MRKVEVGEKGFTLIETIVAAALLSLVFTTISLYYTSLVRLWDRVMIRRRYSNRSGGSG